ncbi:hypothetical protein MHI43_15830 [Paenibacillus sp. FSL H8-0457]|uniref:hypothetical protein n=1 Tax=unclassified Paenibacillus TaxID=185978 RepID=UPI001F25544B|nr:hypothetical protein [Paenibacillus sp. FSL H8-457]
MPYRSRHEGVMHACGRDMIEDGVLEHADQCYALHMMPELPVGSFGVHTRYAMAASSHFRVNFYGTPGHHSSPHLAFDALQMAARYVTEVNALMANRVDPSEAAVLAFGTLHADSANQCHHCAQRAHGNLPGV